MALVNGQHGDSGELLPQSQAKPGCLPREVLGEAEGCLLGSNGPVCPLQWPDRTYRWSVWNPVQIVPLNGLRSPV